MPYTADQTSGQTFDASNYYGAFVPGNAFDDSDSSYWFVFGPSDPEWIEVEFSVAKKIARVRVLYAVLGWDDGPDQVIIKASNTGAFSGEEVTLHTSASGLSWNTSAPEWKEFDFTNSTPYLFYRVYCNHHPAVGHDLLINEIEMMEEEDDERATDDDVGIGDAVAGFSLTDEIGETSGVVDAIDGYKETGDDPIADISGFGDSADAFNWTEWLSKNRDQAVARWYCTITGSADGTTDIEVPISSFQAQKRSGYSTYLSVVIPGVAYADAIADRANGEIVIEMAYLLGGVESIREEIIRAELEQINPYEGPLSRSITLIGHKEQTFASQVSRVNDPIYKYRADGRVGYRFATPDPYLNPGDTAQVGDDEFTVATISYIVSAEGQTVMEVRE